MKARTYTVGMLKNFIKESTNEFQPKIGANVTNDNKKNNKKAVNDITKETSDYDGGLSDEKGETVKIGDNMDYNKTMLDLQFTNEPSEEYKERIQSQLHGYPSKANEEIHKDDEDKSADFEGNKKIYSNIKDRNKKVNKHQKDIKKAGLKASKMPDSQFDADTVFENKEENIKKMKKLNFKNTKFLSESHMVSRIPEDYKVDGNKFIMKDAADNEYLIEWVVDEKHNISKANIVEHSNKTQLKEDIKKINKLFNYKSSDYFKTSNSNNRIVENKKVGEFINDVKTKMSSLKD